MAAKWSRATTDQDAERSFVWCMLWQENHGTLERIGTSTSGVGDSSWDIWQLFRGGEGDLVEDDSFVVVRNKDTSGWENSEVWIQVVRISALQPLHVERPTGAW